MSRTIKLMAAASAFVLWTGNGLLHAGDTTGEGFKLEFFRNNISSAPSGRVAVTNPGVNGDSSPQGDLCALFYIFSPDEQIQECCGCRVTPNGLLDLSVFDDLTANTVTTNRPGSGVIKLISGAIRTAPNPFNPFGPPLFFCDPTNVTPKPTLRAWASHVERSSAPGRLATYSVSVIPFVDAPLGTDEFTDLQGDCAEIQEAGSGKGICGCCTPNGGSCTDSSECCANDCNVTTGICN
jgi:hypothetical protein